MNESRLIAKVDAPDDIGVRTGISGEVVGATSVEVSITTGVVSVPEPPVEVEVLISVGVPLIMRETDVVSQVSMYEATIKAKPSSYAALDSFWT